MSSSRPQLQSPLLWSTVSSLGTQGLSFLVFGVLARLLGAPAFGLVALAALVIDLFLVISNAGINEAVIQRTTLDEADTDTAFWANLGLGLVFCIVTITAAPFVAEVFSDARLSPILMALASIFVITPLGAIHAAKLTRELRFRSLAVRNLVAALAGAAIGLPLAFEGFGVWALVAQRIGSASALVLSAWISSQWAPRLRFNLPAFKSLMRYGSQIGLSSALTQVNIRAAEIISGALIGAVAVAFIRAGSRIVEVLNQLTYTPFHQVAMPVLARSAARADLRLTYLNLSRLSAFVMFPVFFGAFALADELVSVVFGNEWTPVADAVRIFSCAVVASQMNNLIVAALSASGQANVVLKWTGIQILLGLFATLSVHQWGWKAMLIAGVVRAYVVLPFGLYLLRKCTGLQVREVLGSLCPALCSATAMLIIVAGGKSWPLFAMAPLSALMVWTLIGAAVYLATYLYQDRPTIRSFQHFLPFSRA